MLVNRHCLIGIKGPPLGFVGDWQRCNRVGAVASTRKRESVPVFEAACQSGIDQIGRGSISRSACGRPEFRQGSCVATKLRVIQHLRGVDGADSGDGAGFLRKHAPLFEPRYSDGDSD